MKRPKTDPAFIFETRFRIISIDKELSLHIPANSPSDALHDLHHTAQNTMHWNPEDYTVTFVRRSGFAAYDIPEGMTNPDVRRRQRGGNPGIISQSEMFDPAEMESKPDNPSDAQLVAPLAASTPSQP